MSISGVSSSGYSYSMQTRPMYQSDQADQSERAQEMASRLLESLDTDSDGGLSLSEIGDKQELLTQGDTDGDSKLSESELLSLMNKMGPPPPPPGGMGGQEGETSEEDQAARAQEFTSRVLEDLDNDGDGAISAAEMDDKSEFLLQADADADGSVSESELSTFASQMGPPPPPPGGGMAMYGASETDADDTSSDTSGDTASSQLQELLASFMSKYGMDSYQRALDGGLAGVLGGYSQSGGSVSFTA